jgi:hypothetical protein
MTDGNFQTFCISPILIVPDIGPGVIDVFDPWDLAGVARGSYSAMAINTSSVTIDGLVSTGRRGDRVSFQLGGNRGPMLVRHMRSTNPAARIFCPDGIDALVPGGSTVELECLNDTDHGYRFDSYMPSSAPSAGPSADFTLGALTHNWDPFMGGAVTARCWRTTVPRDGAVLTGIAVNPQSVRPNDIITVVNMGDGNNSPTATLTVTNFDHNSDGGERFLLPGFSTPIVIPLFGSFRFRRDEFPSESGAWFVL